MVVAWLKAIALEIGAFEFRLHVEIQSIELLDWNLVMMEELKIRPTLSFCA